jgi:hypothetical protein
MTNKDKIQEVWDTWVPFVFGMRKRMLLKKNLKKKRWAETSVPWLDAHLQHQVIQLNGAIYSGESKGVVLTKAIDVANVAMLLADRYKRGAV